MLQSKSIDIKTAVDIRIVAEGIISIKSRSVGNGRINHLCTYIARQGVGMLIITRRICNDITLRILNRCIILDKAAEIEALINEKFGSKAEITFINGGQPIYYYIISVE